MELTREFFDAGLVYLAAMGLGTALLTAATVRKVFAPIPVRHPELQFGIMAFVATLVTIAISGQGYGTLFAGATSLLVTLAISLLLPRLSFPGAHETALLPLAWIFGAPWGLLLLYESGFPTWSLALALIGSILGLGTLGFTFAIALARQSLLTHESWRRPHAPLPPPPDHRAPKVSIHLPAYAEPPEVVIATLDHLARLDYPHFEVIVCDNNTPDERLWRPVERHCARLNAQCGEERFRFFHVAPLAGAKAGALNWSLGVTAPDAELIAVIDADYVSRPGFLAALTRYFADPAIGYVQTPHDYRGWERNPYLDACYWEYMPSNKIELPGINEYGAPITIGTMCIVRREALIAAGGWAEWCLTEDSELSVRLRAVGYDGVYVQETFGRGLIPETFEDYKKQRFRWTAGPVQQLCRHWRLYLPGRLGTDSGLGGWSRLLEFQRGIEPVLGALALPLSLVGATIGAVLTSAGALPVLDLPPALWAALALGAIAALVRRWHRYRLAGGRTIGGMVRGEFARMSLTYIQILGGFAGLSARPLAWRRTPKFAKDRLGWRALADTLPETVIGLGFLALVFVPLSIADRIGADIAALFAIGCIGQAVTFLAAPAMALLSERGLRTPAKSSPAVRTAAEVETV